MGDIDGTPGGLPHKVNQKYRDDGDGTHSEVRTAQMWLWDNDDLAWRKVTDDDFAAGGGGGGGGTQYDEDSPHTSGDTGTMALAVRNDAGTAFAADGDYVPLSIDSSGALRVTGGGGGTQYTEGDTDASITGSAMLWEDGSDTLRAVSAAKPLPVGDAGGSLTVDGTVTVTQGTATNLKVDASGVAVPVTDNGSSLTVDDGGSTISVDDGGGTLTVDGTVGVSGTVTVDSELTTADLDTGGGTDTRAVVGLVGSKSGGAALIPGDATAGLKVDLGADNDVTVTSGTVTANAGTNLNTSALALESGGNLAAAAASLSVLDDWDETDRAKVNPIAGQAGVQGGSGSVNALTQRVVLATDVALPAGTNAIGKLAANSGVDIGDVDVTSLPALAAGTNLIGKVSASNESSTVYDGSTAMTPKFAVIDHATSGDNTLVAAVNPKKIRVLSYTLVASAAVTVRFESGASGTALTGQMQLAANGGVHAAYNPNGHFETASNTLLNLELSGAISVDGHLTYVEV